MQTDSALIDPDLRTRTAASRLEPNVAVLTAGKDKPYALGIAAALIEQRIPFELIGSNFVDGPILHGNPLVTYRNLRGDQAENAPLHTKTVRVLRYYARLLAYAIKARPKVFHILWNNKFEWFDRTILLLFYRMCGRRLVYTAHNVNMGERDGTDSFMNRLTLRIQYNLVDDIFVHTELMAHQLQSSFGVPERKVHVIPFPINSTPPDTELDRTAARGRLGLRSDERVLLFYGTVAPYKGLQYLVEALAELPKHDPGYRLLISGGIKKSADEYWRGVQETISRLNLAPLVLSRIEYIPDEETEIYFKAADVLVLPYTYIFQSGLPFLSYNFGLPILAADVGSLKDAIVEGKTGFAFRPRDAQDLAKTIEKYFRSDLYQHLAVRRRQIRDFAMDRYSWARVAGVTIEVYQRLLGFELKRSA